MPFPLNSFESHLPTDILQKGKDYWDNGAVSNLIENDKNFEAIVYGSEDYEVEIKVNNGSVESWFCDCPYDWGPICKHVAAVLIEIREQQHSIKYSKGIENKSDFEEKKDPFQTILDQLEAEELRAIIQYFTKKNKDLKTYLLTKYANLIQSAGKEHFLSLVTSVIQAQIDGRYGYLEYSSASRLGNKLCNLLEETEKNLPEGDEMQLVHLCEIIIKEVSKVYTNADDSSGNLSGAISSGILQLTRFTDFDADSSKEILEYIFQFALEEMNKEIFRRSDWGYDLKELAIKAARNENQIDQIISSLDQIIKPQDDGNWASNYQAESAARLKLALLAKWKGPAVAATFLKAHLHFSSFRKLEIEKAIKDKNYQHANELAKEGVKLDSEKRLPGLVKTWKDYLLKIAQESGNNHAIEALTKKMFLETREMSYFRQLRSQISDKEFKEKVEQFLKYFRSKERPSYWGIGFNTIIANIFIEEKRWEDLMKEIMKQPSLKLLDQFEEYLSSKFKETYRNIYEEKVREMMENNTGRSVYEMASEYLLKIIALGGKDQAKKMVEDWKTKYPRRKAMLEELDQFKNL